MHSSLLISLLLPTITHFALAQDANNTIFPDVPLTNVYINDTRYGLAPIAYYITPAGIALINGDEAYGTKEELEAVIVQPDQDQVQRLKKRSQDLDGAIADTKRRRVTGRGGSGFSKRANTIFPNDILFDEPPQTKPWTRSVWASNTVLYKYKDAASEAALSSIIDAAIKRWTDEVPCLQFKKEPTSATLSTEVVTVFQDADVNGNSLCYSSIGGLPGNTNTKVLSPCGVNEATHEWGHNIGFMHENKRHDRDFFTTFKCENLRDFNPAKRSCCEDATCCGLACEFTRDLTTYSNIRGLENGGAYDIDSLMQYRRSAFAKPGTETLSRGPTFNPSHPSPADIARAKELYDGPTCNIKPPKCPLPCNVYSNNCHFPSAQTCIFPNPFSANPRPACACAPGFKSANADNDSSKHWRLPIVGQEHRVWVAEGVECSTRCQGFGVDACKEVVILGPECA